MRYRAQPATSFDVAFLAMVLDETGGAFVDRTGMKPANRLLKSCAFSAQIWTTRDLGDSTPAALWGVVPQPDDPDVGCLWMLAADPFDEAPDELETLSRLVLAEMLGEFPRLENHIDARKDRALELLRSIGFTVEPGVRQPTRTRPCTMSGSNPTAWVIRRPTAPEPCRLTCNISSGPALESARARAELRDGRGRREDPRRHRRGTQSRGRRGRAA